MKVCVLLSTYNGEKFLEEQLESIIAQEGVAVDILVRDDGSNDGTCHILDRWQDDGKLRWYKGGNLGFALSFIDLVLKAPEYDYYAFCDQDDVWFSDKLKRAVCKLEAIEEPIKLYCSNVEYYKNGQAYGGIHKVVPYFDKYTCLVRNIAPGCSMVFSPALKDLIASAPPRKIIAHDFWIFQLAVLMGKVVYDFEPSMLYRQHENNQIGQKTSRVEIWKRRVKNLCSDANRHDREDQAKELLWCHTAVMSEDCRSIVSKVAEYRSSLAKRFALMIDGQYSMGDITGDIYLKLRVLSSRL